MATALGEISGTITYSELVGFDAHQLLQPSLNNFEGSFNFPHVCELPPAIRCLENSLVGRPTAMTHNYLAWVRPTAKQFEGNHIETHFFGCWGVSRTVTSNVSCVAGGCMRPSVLSLLGVAAPIWFYSSASPWRVPVRPGECQVECQAR